MSYPAMLPQQSVRPVAPLTPPEPKATPKPKVAKESSSQAAQAAEVADGPLFARPTAGKGKTPPTKSKTKKSIITEEQTPTTTDDGLTIDMGE